jgi:hypothetical protein
MYAVRAVKMDALVARVRVLVVVIKLVHRALEHAVVLVLEDAVADALVVQAHVVVNAVGAPDAVHRALTAVIPQLKVKYAVRAMVHAQMPAQVDAPLVVPVRVVTHVEVDAVKDVHLVAQVHAVLVVKAALTNARVAVDISAKTNVHPHVQQSVRQCPVTESQFQTNRHHPVDIAKVVVEDAPCNVEAVHVVPDVQMVV